MFNTSNCLGQISKQDHAIFLTISALMKFLKFVHDRLHALKVDSLVKNIWPNCHSSCRAVHIQLGHDLVEVVDGSIAGVGKYIVLGNDQNGDILYEKMEDSINHSWLRLAGGAIVDPFPAGVWAASPLLFPPIGKYQDIFPGSVYVEGKNCPFAKTEQNWMLAENLAHVFTFCPVSYEKVKWKDEIVLDEILAKAAEAAEFVIVGKIIHKIGSE